TLLARLGEGTARFELLEDPAPAPAPPVWPRLHCFARIGSSLRGGWSAALNKVEHYGVQRVTGDGRCMFRALAKGMAKTRGIPLTPREEVQDAGSPILCLAHGHGCIFRNTIILYFLLFVRELLYFPFV
uniref:Uncharacterized protein n=1 Tax=Aegilops tauschii subsp. strangulata TaxID=200361 RepID=A0A453IFB7_AEGTS